MPKDRAGSTNMSTFVLVLVQRMAIASSAGHTSHSSSFDHRRRPETFFTAIATAFFCPTSTTSFLPRVAAVRGA
jgi:hypothetical protein